MGHDLHPFANHTLNVSSTQALADDLAAQLRTTIVWGYRDFWDRLTPGIEPSTPQDWSAYAGTGEFVPRGYAGSGDGMGDLLFLEDCNYCDRIQRPNEYNTGLDYELYYPAHPSEPVAGISRHALRPNASWELGRWWAFTRFFTGELDDWNYMDTFRRQVQLAIAPFGGTQCLYLDDQGPSAALEAMPDTHTWEEIVAHGRTEFGERFLEMSRWLAGRYAYSLREAEPPLVVLDDFSFYPPTLPRLYPRTPLDIRRSPARYANYEEGWAGWLRGKYENDHVYDLIMSLSAEWEPNHELDFIVVRESDLTDTLRASLSRDRSRTLRRADYCFPEADITLLAASRMAPYLEPALSFREYEDRCGRRFARAVYRSDEVKDWRDRPAGFLEPPYFRWRKMEPQKLKSEADALPILWQIIGEEGPCAAMRVYADMARDFLRRWWPGRAGEAGGLFRAHERAVAWHTVGLAYWMIGDEREAEAADAQWLYFEKDFYPASGLAAATFELLMARGVWGRLDILFADVRFLKSFPGHYDATQLLRGLAEKHCVRPEALAIAERVENAELVYAGKIEP